MLSGLRFLKRTFVIVGWIAVGIALLQLANAERQASLAPSDRPTLVPPKLLKYFTLGYNEVVADSLWLRTIQDFDYCENRPVGELDPNKFKCERGWVYKMIDSITEIAPRFRQPYYSGALMLSVIGSDKEGSSAIFDKGVTQFPKDWNMLYMASYQAMHEEKDPVKASRLLAEAGRNGAPLWVLSLAARLREQTGELELARSIMANAVENAPDSNQGDYFRKRLAEIDKKLAEANNQSTESSKH